MPFPERNKAKNKRYYSDHQGHIKHSRKQRYAANRDTIASNQQQRVEAQQVNPSRAREASSKRVRRHYHNDVQKSREGLRERKSREYWTNPAKQRHRKRHEYRVNLVHNRLSVRHRVSHRYHRNVHKSRALSRTTTVRQYMKDVDKSRMKTRHTSKKYYRKRAAYENAVCKKAASHLVRTSLQARRRAVYTILDTKKKVMDKDLRGRQDFGHTGIIHAGNHFTTRHVTHGIICQVRAHAKYLP